MTPEERLAELGHELRRPNPAVGNYVGAVTVGNIVFVSGHGPYRTGELRLQGQARPRGGRRHGPGGGAS